MCMCADIMSLYAQIRRHQLGRAMNSLLQNNQTQSLLPANVNDKAHWDAVTLVLLLLSYRSPRKVLLLRLVRLFNIG